MRGGRSALPQDQSPDAIASECERSLAQLRSALDNTLRLFGEVRDVRQSMGVSQMGALLAANARGGAPGEAEQRYANIEQVISKQLGEIHHRIVASGVAPFAGAVAPASDGSAADGTLASSTWVPLTVQEPLVEQSEAGQREDADSMSVDQSIGMSLNMSQLGDTSLGQSSVNIDVEPFLERYSDLLLSRIVEKLKTAKAMPPPPPP